MAWIAPHPLSWIGKPSVGSGECVALVEAAAAAMPRSGEWSRGVPMQGNMSIPFGTIIATFGANGRYGSTTDGSSHAAIYFGQTTEGIIVIDQWNLYKNHVIIGRQPPHKRLIRFKNPHGKPVDIGTNYYVVE